MTWLRSAAFNVWFYGVTTVLCLVALALRFRTDGSRPRRPLAYARLWARTVLAGLRPLAGIEYRVSGMEHLPDGPALIAAQHQSAFETVLWAALLPRICFVLKQELLAVPLFGRMLRVTGMIAVDREGGAAALRSMLLAGSAAARAGRQILVFPEGTRVAVGARAPLHVGIAALAVRTGLPVVPALTDSGRLWGRNAFRKQPGVIRVQILPPLPAGLPRDVLLERLSALFAAGPEAGEPVDGSVHEPPTGFTNNSSAGQ